MAPPFACLLLVLAGLASTACAPVATFWAALALHPRLILTPARLAVVKGFVATNAQAAAYFAALQEQGAFVLTTAPMPRPPENATDILMAARAVLTRTYVLSLLYRLTDNSTWAARATEELLSFTAWADWDIVKHALDAGELSHAAAIGLDWCYAYLQTRPADLAAIVAGIVAKSGEPFRAAYAAGPHGSSWWTCDVSNWAQVTNGGAGLAALAILGEPGVPDWMPQILANATRGVNCSASAIVEYGGGYRGGGGWFEGPIYHGYSARYFVPFVSGLETATGSDSAFFALPGVLDAASYQMRAMGPAPVYSYFDWADSETGQETLAMLLTVAERKGDAAAAFVLRNRLDVATPHILPGSRLDGGGQDCMEFAHALLYFTPLGSAADLESLPLDVAYPLKKVALLRSSWTDTNAAFVGLKACNCSFNHGDLDHGTFVFSWAGQRFIMDMGVENYGLPNYFGSDRFKYYRKNSHGANSISINGSLQVAQDCGGYSLPGPAPPQHPTTFLTSFGSRSGIAFEAADGHPLAACVPDSSEQACATIDLTLAYQGQGVRQLVRQFALGIGGAYLQISDSWDLEASPTDIPVITAALHTPANATLASDGKSVLLELGGRATVVTLPPGGACAGYAVMKLTPVRLLPPQTPSMGVTRIDVSVDPRACLEGGLDVRVAGVQ